MKAMKRIEDITLEDYLKWLAEENLRKDNKFTPIRVVLEDGIEIRRYNDNMFGETFGNLEIWKDGKIQMHATVKSDSYTTKEQLEKYYRESWLPFKKVSKRGKHGAD